MLLRIGSVAAAVASMALAQQITADHFEQKIRPVLAQRCYGCHNSSLAAPQGGLLLDSVSGIRRGGNSGPLFQPEDADRSLLLRALRHTDKDLKMPPGKPLPPEAVAGFEAWIRAGAPMPEDRPVVSKRQSDLWSLQKPRRPATPTVRDATWSRNDIDRFILSRLEAKNLSPSPEADKRTLIRRASYDLTGLPPTAEEVEQFANDTASDAYSRLVDRLLASPHYGERWGRHWLDVARYADSVNDSVNAGQRFPWSYTYRDWVVRAFNDDLPYDQFVMFQLAADRVPNADPKHLAALGFLSLGREFPKSYPETVDDRIDAVTRGFLGLTVACARCHDHKFDPIPTKDYYSLYSVLSNIRQPKYLPLLGKSEALSPKESMYQERLDRIEAVHQDYRRRRHAEMVAFFKTQTAEYLLAAHDAESLSNGGVEELVRDRQLNNHLLARWRKFLSNSKSSGDGVFRIWHAAAALTPAEFAAKWESVLGSTQGNPLVSEEFSGRPMKNLRELAAAYAGILARYGREERFDKPEAEQLRAVTRGIASPVDVPLEEFEQIYTEGDSNNTRSIRVRYNAMLAQAAYDGAAPRAMAFEDVPHPAPTHVFLRGNQNNPGALAPPHFLSCLGGSDKELFQDGSGRLDLAKAILDPSNPLTARVMVNRIWMHHFGFGLVRTPSDFGFRGDKPTHPELLDYLALKFVESGWSVKQLHRLIMNSAAYRQASSDSEAGRKADPENLLLWRMNRRRLEIESIRDSVLVAAGRLDPMAGGVPFSLTAQPAVTRRSLYGFIERGRVPALLSAFDFSSPDQHAPMRFVTTVPQQALFFLNSPFVAEQAGYTAARIASSTDASEKIKNLYRILFARQPSQTELAAGLHFISKDDEQSADAKPSSPWQYGTGEASFIKFSTFVPDRWQGGAALPAGETGKAFLTAGGGEPGEGPAQAVVRRWISPASGKVTIEGTLRHGQGAVPYGDGVRGRILSSRDGELASWSVNGTSAETKLAGIQVEPGDILDFVVDARLDPENDTFGWSPSITLGTQTWSAKNDFAGPAPSHLPVWARYVQVLLGTNEFAFVD